MSASPFSLPRVALAAHPASRLRPAVLAHATWWMVCVAYAVLKVQSSLGAAGWQVDLDVYSRGGVALARGEDLYAVSVHGLRFTYPPVAALVAAIVGRLPDAVVGTLLLALSVVALGVVLVSVGRRLGLSPLVVASVAAGTLVSEPVYRTLLLGQVNALLMALVVLDLLVVRRGRQGLLVGLAAGIKLVPGVFVLYFLLRRDLRGAALSAVGFVTTVLVGAVVDPSGSRWYWAGGALALDKFGLAGVFATDNQSLSVAVDRLRHDPTLPTVLTLVLGALALTVGALVARRCLARDDRVAAVLALALASLLASPVSWTHHWVWLAPTVLVLLAWRRPVVAAVVSIVALVGPMWLLPRSDWSPLGFSLGQGVVGASYTLLGIALLVVLLRGPSGTRGAAPSQGVEDAARRVLHTVGPRRGRTGVLLRPRRRDGGAAAVEAAIVLPVLFVVLFGIIEFGFVFRDDIAITNALRAGTRYASIGKTGDPTFPAGAVTQVANGLTGVNMSGFQSMWLYDATSSTAPPSACPSATCLSYTWNPVARAFGSPSGSFNPCSVATVTGGRVALYLAVKHTAFTALVPASPTISDKAVFAFEPGACT